MAPGRYTELFFLDEATAFAAGHRPCAECRREDYNQFLEVWRELHPDQHGADAIDLQLHSERMLPGSPARRRLHGLASGAELPDGAFVLSDEGSALLVLGGGLLEWTPRGYAATGKAVGTTRLLTPPSLLAVLSAGWEPVVPLLHPTAYSSTRG